jgi:putative ABC transport system permease protein
MNLGEVARTALAEIRHHKLRSTLTLLGVILGTLSITVMTSFLDGVIAAVYDGFNDLGYDGVMIVVNRDARDLTESAIFTRSRGLQPEDADLLMSRRQAVSMVAPEISGESVVRRGKAERKARVMGVTQGYAVLRHRKMEAGRFIRTIDESSYARVCVLGYRLRRRLFGTEDPVGKDIAVDGRPFRVIGVVKKLGNEFVDDDEFVEEMEGLYVPLATMRKFTTGDDAPLSFLAVKTDDPENLGALESEIVSSLKIAHRGAQDFRIQNIAQEMLRARQELKGIVRSWRIVLSSIAGISLLVGGIGLLSVMLISIGERLYEIGLEKALGATDLEVFLQFLAEAVVLSSLGGVLGAGAGVALTKAVSGFFSAGLPINLPGLGLAFGVSVALGVVYGIYPALKASRLAPVEALRSAA